MKRPLLTLLCLGVLGTATGCPIDPARSGATTAFEVGIAAYQEDVPYWDDYPAWRYRQWDGWHNRRPDWLR